MRTFLLATIIVMLVLPLFFFSFPEIKAASNSTPFIPHGVRVLVVSPASVYLKGGHYLISDLARYGFNVTQHTSDDSTVNYCSDPKTADLNQYDVVILHGSYIGWSPTTVTIEEVNHFTNYGGVLMVIGNALFWNETSREFWGNFETEPILRLEQRLGVSFTAWLKDAGATYKHSNGSFTLTDSSISGLPPYLAYISHNPDWVNYQVVATPKEARKIYDFTTEDGFPTSGVTYYENATSAVGIYIQGSYIYAAPEDAGTYRIRYFGLTDISKRSSLLASLIAHALGADLNTVIKPQSLATIRLDGLGSHGWGEANLNNYLLNLNSIVSKYAIIPTIAFAESPDFNPKYWQKTVPNILSQLKGRYRNWEYGSSLRNKDLSSMTQSEIEFLIEDVKANYTALGMDLFSTVATFARYWNRTILYAMAGENLTLLDVCARTPEYGSLENYYTDWWNLRVLFNVILHSGAQMGWWGEAESFTDIDSDPNVAKDILHYEYFRDRDKWALASVNGFPSFVYSIWHFAQNEVGTYSLKTVYSNLTSEIPDVRFVPLIEAGLYFGNKWVRIENSTRVGSTIEFDLDSSAIPEVVSIGKGMLWLRIGTEETIREVSIGDEPWFYFDDHTVRLPAESVHVKVTLGERVDPTVVRTVYKVTETRWDSERFTVSVSATSGLNVSIRLLIPLLDVFCNEAKWNYTFDASAQVLDFWAISDGSITLEVGADATPPVMGEVDCSPTWYNTSVTIAVNITDLKSGVGSAILSYSSGSDWIDVTMVANDSLYVEVIPAFSYGTLVRYRLYASDLAGNWRISEIFNYTVTDETPPEIGVPEWDPASPSAGQPVLVRVSVGEPENSSGIDTVTLWYFLHDDSYHWQPVEMTYENDMWRGEIPGKGSGRVVSFLVRATDEAGNVRTTESYRYNVGGGGVPPLYMLVVGLALAGVAVGVGVYFKKFRKTKSKVGTQK